MEENKNVKLIVAMARNYFIKNYGYSCDSKGNITYEIYTDYHDTLHESIVEKAFEFAKGDKQEMLDYLNEEIFQSYIDLFCDKESDLAKEVVEYMEKRLDEETLERLEEDGLLDHSEVREVLLDFGVVTVTVDYDDIIARSELDLVILLENHNSIDSEFSLNNFNGNIETWIEETQELLNSGENQEEDFSLITLLKSQGYTWNQFKEEVERFYSDEVYRPKSRFIRSLIDECYNTTSCCNSLVFLVQTNLLDYLKGEDGINIIEKNTKGGYVDFVFGGGSILDIDLDVNIPLDTIAHEKFIDGQKYGYSLKSIYGEFIR